MTSAAELLALPVERAARRLALRFLDEAAAAHARMERGDDEEALHDFRVGLRRLRSAVRAYRQYLGGSVGRKDRRRLKALADATGEARDAEVHIVWLEKRLDRFEGGERAGADAFLAELRGELDGAMDRLRREVTRDFPRERWRLARRLRFFRVEVDLDDPSEGPLLASVAGRLAGEAAAEMERELARVRSIEDQERAHEARIAGKRLRYLMEPFADDVEGAKDAVKRLKKAQDTLGDMHDADVLLARVTEELDGFRVSYDGRADGGDAEPAEADRHDVRPGLRALAALLERERGEHFARLEEGWLDGRGAEFFAEVREVARRFTAMGQPDREIERKFLLRRMPPLAGLPVVVQEIDQGYLPGDRLNERLRRVRVDGEVRYYRTVKVGAGISRVELEEETTEPVFRRLWSLTRGKRVRKRRYRVKDGAFTWEIDRFRDRRLVLAEVELPSEDTVAEPPVWLRRLIVRDVTGEPEYVNLNLAK